MHRIGHRWNLAGLQNRDCSFEWAADVRRVASEEQPVAGTGLATEGGAVVIARDDLLAL